MPFVLKRQAQPRHPGIGLALNPKLPSDIHGRQQVQFDALEIGGTYLDRQVRGTVLPANGGFR